jgi:hypothetical protein
MTTVEERAPAPEGDASPPVARERGVRMSTLFYIAFAIAGGALGLHQLHDNSFLWHLRTGKLILDHGIPRSDPYSFTAAGTTWVAQSWLVELTYGAIDRSVGAFGIRLFDAAISAAIGWSCFYLAYKTSKDRVRAFGLALLAMCVLVQVMSERPLLVGLLAMAIVIIVCEIPDAWVSRRPEITLPIVMWLWANSHGTFAIGFCYLALHVFGRALDGAPWLQGRERKITIGTAISAVVVFLNPYGIELVLFPVHLLSRGSVLNNVEEWQSPNFRELGGFFFGAFIVAAIVILVRKGASKRDLLITVAFIVLGLWAVRNVGLAVLACLPILARAVAREPGHVRPDVRSSMNRVVALGLVVVGLLFVVRADHQTNFDLKNYPVAAFDAIHDKGFEGRHLLTTDAWGGYVIAVAWPQQHVFFDDRYDMYPLSVDAAYTRLAAIRPGWEHDLDTYGIDVVMWPKNGALVQALALTPDWAQIYEDKTAVVFVRRSLLPH